MRNLAPVVGLTLAVALSLTSPLLSQAGHAHVNGTWDVHIEHFTGRIVDEQWVLEQDGQAVRGTVLVRDQKYPIDGMVEGQTINLRVTVAAGTTPRYNIFLGTITNGRIAGDIKKENDDGRFTASRAAH